MATKQSKGARATTATATTTPAANPMTALVQAVTQAPAAAPAVGVKAKAASVLAALPQGTVNSVGAAVHALPPSLAARGVAVGIWPVTVQAHSYTLGPKLAGGNCPARGLHDVAVVGKLHALAAAAQGAPLTAAVLAGGGVPWHSMAAYLKRGWIVSAA